MVHLNKKLLTFFLILFGVSACSHSPVTEQLTPEEAVRRRQGIGAELAQRLEGHLQVKSDSAVRDYLQKLTLQLKSGVPELQGATVSVQLFKSGSGTWQSYGLPGPRVYVSLEVLKLVKFENELAAEIALQLAHLQKKHLLYRLVGNPELEFSNLALNVPDGASAITSAVPKAEDTEHDLEALFWKRPKESINQIVFFGNEGIFAFSSAEQIVAFQTAVEILYHAGYDARGLIGLLDLYQTSGKHTPVDEELNQILKDAVRRKIATYVPLLNPIVKTSRFQEIHKRIAQL